MFPDVILLAEACLESGLESDRAHPATLGRLRRIGIGARVRWGRHLSGRDRTVRGGFLAIHLAKSKSIEALGKSLRLFVWEGFRYDGARIMIDTTMLPFSVELYMRYGACTAGRCAEF
jgi:hypothetical protein